MRQFHTKRYVADLYQLLRAPGPDPALTLHRRTSVQNKIPGRSPSNSSATPLLPEAARTARTAASFGCLCARPSTPEPALRQAPRNSYAGISLNLVDAKLPSDTGSFSRSPANVPLCRTPEFFCFGEAAHVQVVHNRVRIRQLSDAASSPQSKLFVRQIRRGPPWADVGGRLAKCPHGPAIFLAHTDQSRPGNQFSR